MSKYFLVNPDGTFLQKGVIEEIRLEKEKTFNDSFSAKREYDKARLMEEDKLLHIEGRVVVKIDLDSKDSWTFENGMKIEYKRRFNNFNQREASPVNAIVISGEGITKGAEILIHPNAIHDSNRIYDYKDSNDTIRYYAIHNDMCFSWNDGKEWKPLPPYEFALRVFRPYEGLISGIEPTQIKDVLFVTSGELKNKAVKTLVASDYQICFQGRKGREEWLIRFRPNGDEKNKREPEAIAIMDEITDKIFAGEYLLGYTTSDAKTIQEINPYMTDRKEIKVSEIKNGDTIFIKRVSDGVEKSIVVDDIKDDVIFEFEGKNGFKGYSLYPVIQNPNNFIITVNDRP